MQAAAATVRLPDTARRIPRGNLHLTLHFIGNVYFSDMACMREQASRVDADAFQLVIDRQGCFGKARVGWLGCSEIPAALVRLHQQLGMRLQSCAFQPEARPYNPHITIARKVGSIDSATEFDALVWPVREFALIEVQAIENGVQYRVVESWPLK